MTTTAINPSTYAWEPTTESLAAAHGLEPSAVVRFDTNTPPAPPDLARRVIAAGRFDPGLSEYAPSDYGQLAAAAAGRYGVRRDQVLVGAGADEILDLAAKAHLAPGSTAVTATPTYAMYRVVTEQRGAAVIEVPRLGPADAYAIDTRAVREAARTASVVWLCDPNNPTATTDGPDVLAVLLEGLAADAARDGRPVPTVVLDEAYAEFTGVTAIPLLGVYPRLVIVRTLSKAYCLAGLRVGFALANRETLEPIERYRPPGSVSIVSVTVGAAVLADPDLPRPEIERVTAERRRLADGLATAGWHVEPSVTNFVVVRFETDAEAGTAAGQLLARGLVPRTFGRAHPLAACLRLTVRSAEENDRLIAAAREIAR